MKKIQQQALYSGISDEQNKRITTISRISIGSEYVLEVITLIIAFSNEIATPAEMHILYTYEPS